MREEKAIRVPRKWSARDEVQREKEEITKLRALLVSQVDDTPLTASIAKKYGPGVRRELQRREDRLKMLEPMAAIEAINAEAEAWFRSRQQS
jgi:hypothetical protein